MALIFQRLARNYIKNGYFPTDEVTLSRILAALDVGALRIRVLDPCCGEGVALAEAKHFLTSSGALAEAFGGDIDFASQSVQSSMCRLAIWLMLWSFVTSTASTLNA